MIDTLLRNVSKADKSNILKKIGVKKGQYALVTLHRPSNVDDAKILKKFLRVFEKISHRLPVIFPAHPRTLKNIRVLNFAEGRIRKHQKLGVSSNKGLLLMKPLGYLDFLAMMTSAKVVLTDSGGIQEETTILKIPCLTRLYGFVG